MKIAYLDCFSGISGDMFLGALLDLGLPPDELRHALKGLPLAGWELHTAKEGRNHIFGTRLVVKVDPQTQVARGLREVCELIEAGGLPPWVTQKSVELFQALAGEEAKIHHVQPEEIHFHEVGAVDSIVDVVGTLFGIERLGIGLVAASSLPLGSGFVETSHGPLPLPAPATLALLKGIPVYDSGLKAELVTPTGAALVKTLAVSFGALPPMTIEAVGYGVGTSQLPDRPNLLRIILGQDRPGADLETVVLLEANLDDTTPEWIGYLMERLFQAGALDVFFTPIQMKKNRPGTLVQVMGRPHEKEKLMHILFMESTTLGVRFHYSERKVLKRASLEMDSPWGRITVKQVVQPDGSSLLLPEYETCREIAAGKGIPIKEIYYWVLSQNRK